MLYTGKGDNGTTTTFGSNERVGKDSALIEALGTADELNSFLGFVKSKSQEDCEVLEAAQQNLFIIQAELAGADKHIEENKLREIETIIKDIERALPPIKTFFVPGANEASSLLDVARTMARRLERRVISLRKEDSHFLSPFSLAYLNRLSSLLYALARLRAGGEETKPHYL